MFVKQRFVQAVVMFMLLVAQGNVPAGAQPAKVAARSRPVIAVHLTWPGANAQVVEETLAGSIEALIQGTEKIASMISQSANDGQYRLLVTFGPGVDLDWAQEQIKNRVNLAMPKLPESVKRLGVTIKKQSPGPIMLLAVFSPDASRDIRFVGNYAVVQMKSALSRVSGVGEVNLFGEPEYAVRLWLDPDKLAVFDLSAVDVTRAIQEKKPKEAAERDELDNLMVKTTASGQSIRLRDIARVEFGVRSAQTFARFDGKPAVVLGIAPTATADLRELRTAIREAMNRLKKAFPVGIESSIALDLTPGFGTRGSNKLGGYLLVEPAFPDGVSAERTIALLERCGTLLKDTPSVQHVVVLSENPFARFRSGPCILVLLGPKNGKGANRDRLTREIRKRLNEVEDVKFRLIGAGSSPPGYAVDFAIHGLEADLVRAMGEKLVERLAQSEKLTDVSAQPRGVSAPRLHMDIDRKKAATVGVTTEDIFSTLQASMGSLYAGEIKRLGKEWPVHLQIHSRARENLEELKRLKIRGAEGNMVPLSSLVTLRQAAGPDIIARFNGRPMVNITANPAPEVSVAKARLLCEKLAEEVRKEMKLSNEYRLTWLSGRP